MNTAKFVVSLIAIFALSYGAVTPGQAHAREARASQVAVDSVISQVNLNKATLEELEAIRGIGPALAERIVAYRTENGKFETVDQLMSVRGIGQAKFDRIKSQLLV
jgi:competence protein ComEA